MVDWITDIISSLNYWGIALLMVLENIFPPLPSEVIMPLAGFTANQGKLRLLWVIVSGVIGSVLGALPWYYVGRTVGEKRLKRWADRHGKWLTVSGEDIDKSKRWFNKYGGSVVFFGRLIPAIRTLISIPAGLEDMSFFPFLLYSTIGTFLWVGLLAYAGYLLGENYQLVKQYLGPVTIVVIAAIAIALSIWFIRRKRKQK
ncbi:MAG: DedA family protein [Scytonema sp. PMC 1069.18]|nr:DedA family protein [Scytonema sp. PMC 1069.18]MEC4883560.1 DedA family protein [Scytonema sp. PMC 1070.18]